MSKLYPQGYVDGYTDCLNSIASTIENAKNKHGFKSSESLIAIFNSIVERLYNCKEELQRMNNEIEGINPFEEEKKEVILELVVNNTIKEGE